MKYGITSLSEEASFEKGQDVRSEVVESNETATAVMAKNGVAVAAGETTSAVLVKHAVTDEDTARDAVIFSIQFYGKTIGEVGMMDQDLAELDWKKFKSYLFQNLLSVNHQENICVSYSDEEGDKLPIDSDEEYQEAVKVAKKKAEMHDKMVLDITRQGGFPAMLSLVSSGIKKVSSSPPKEGGISFFKASSPPKDTSGMKAVGTERKLFPAFFLPDKGPIPGHVQGLWGYDCDEALECGKISATSTTTTTTTTTTSVPTARNDCKRGPPVRALRNSPPNLLFKYEAPTLNLKSTTIDSACQGVFGAGNGDSTGARPKDVRIERNFGEQPPSWFTSYMDKFRSEVCEEVTERVAALYRNEICEEVGELVSTKVTEALRINKLISSELDEGQSGWSHLYPAEQRQVATEDKSQRVSPSCKKTTDFDQNENDLHNKEKLKKRLARVTEAGVSAPCPESGKIRRKDGKNLGAKQKKLIIEEERLLKKQEKLERKKFILASKYAEERDKATRTQEKVLAKMEGLRKKQSCSQEEFSKLRKMVDKQQRLITAEQRQQRRNERKAGYQKSGKSKKINIDNKGFPVDASLLHAALQELEALAEDSMSDGAGGATTRGYDARYLKDITFPDGSVVAPGTEFVKTWRVVNNGVMPWNEKTTLCKWSQVRFRGSPAGWKLKPSMKRVVCPPLEPGQEGDISITFTAPSEPGWYATHWRFCQRGRVFGNQMWCAIHVVEEPTGFDAPTMEFAKNARDENGVAKRTVTADEMPELSAVFVCQQDPRDLFLGKHACHGRDLCKDVFIPHPREELSMNTDLGIVENYYDAEDPVQRECTESLQKLTLFSPNAESHKTDERKDRDLISFEEEAEVVGSGTSTPEIISGVSQAHSVVPLKEMAKESVENLIIKDPELKSQLKPTVLEEAVQADSISMSSGSFSELDSEDQAILNESDSEGSDQEYYVVHLPDCFNMSSLHNGVPKLNEADAQEMVTGSCGDNERPDSTDFLTADEDDRTTAVASDSSDDLTCPVNDHDYASRSSTVSQASSRINHAKNKVPFESQNATVKASAKGTEAESVASSSLPDPPTDTKPFMSIPNEAIQATVLNIVPEVPSEQNFQASKEQEQDINTWASGTDGVRNVVCEQPYSAQHKESQEDTVSQDDGTSPSPYAANASANNLSSQLPVDLVGALPDELVSIIPEDLVRGAWNTARSFITRINQEMLSPTSDSPGRVYAREEEPSNEQQPQASPSVAESFPQHNEVVQDSTNTVNEREVTSPLPPPLQQLEDMGFHNREVNERLLTKYNGDVSCAVAELIVLNYH